MRERERLRVVNRSFVHLLSCYVSIPSYIHRSSVSSPQSITFNLSLTLTTIYPPPTSSHTDFSRFLTNWGLFLAIITTTLGTLSNILPSVTFIRNLKRGVLLVALPLGIVISTIYVS